MVVRPFIGEIAVVKIDLCSEGFCLMFCFVQIIFAIYFEGWFLVKLRVQPWTENNICELEFEHIFLAYMKTIKNQLDVGQYTIHA